MTPGLLVVAAWVVVVVLLAGYVTVTGPAANTAVYRYETVVEPTVEVLDESTELKVTGVDSEEAELWLSGAGGVVITASTDVAVDDSATTATGAEDLAVRPQAVDGSSPRIEAGVPALVLLRVEQTMPVDDELVFASVHLPTVPVEVTMPLVANDAVVARIRVRMTPIPVTGDELGIPGIVDIPDQRLPRPAPGEAIPTQLQDGRPVWVVGMEDDVAVLDARSPHRYSGLVGWCGSSETFIDSIGSSRFAATGDYQFGPAPHGLVPYEAEVADDHVVVTRRLAPAPRPTAAAAGYIEPAGAHCEMDHEVAARAIEDGYSLEDYRGDPTWVQHDLAEWPRLEEADGGGWFRTDEHDLGDGGPQLVGDLLVHRQQGRIVDAAAPPGTARTIFEEPSGERTVQLVQIESPDGPIPKVIAVRDVIWVTANGIAPASAAPPSPRELIATGPVHSYQLTDDARIDAEVGDVVTVTLNDGRAITITTLHPD